MPNAAAAAAIPANTVKSLTRFTAARNSEWANSSCVCELRRPHIVVWVEEGKLVISPECGSVEHAPKAAGHLFLAGVPLTTKQNGSSTCLVTDRERVDEVAKILTEAGADVTLSGC